MPGAARAVVAYRYVPLLILEAEKDVLDCRSRHVSWVSLRRSALRGCAMRDADINDEAIDRLARMDTERQ